MNGECFGPGHEGPRWISVADAEALRQAAYRRIVVAAARAIEFRGSFLIVLAGGSTARGAYRLLRDADTDWSRWQVYFGDERCLPAADRERNSLMAAEAWLKAVPIPQDRVHAIPAELGAGAAAQAYAETLRGVGDFDLVRACFPGTRGALSSMRWMYSRCSMRPSRRRSECRSVPRA